MNNYLINLASLLIASIPLLLMTGPLLPELSLFLLIILFFYLSSYKEKKIFLTSLYFKIFLIFWIILILISLINLNLTSFYKSFSYLRFGLFFISIQYFVTKNDKIYKYIFISLAAIITFLFFDGMYQFIYKINLFDMVSIDYPRISSVFGEELVMGSFTSRFLPIFLSCYYFYYSKVSKLKFFTFLLFILSLVIITISGERMSIIFAIFVCVYSFIFIINKSKLNIMISSILILFFSLIIFLNNDLKIRIINQTFDEMGLSNDKSYQNNFAVEDPIFNGIYLVSPAHQSYYKTAFNMFKNKPLTGHGIKSFRIKCSDKKYSVNKESCSTHPHNTYIQLLAETGIFTFIIVFSIFLILIKNLILNLFNKKFISKYELCLMCSVLITIWPLATTGSFYNNWLSIIYFFPVGLFKNKITNTEANRLNV